MRATSAFVGPEAELELLSAVLIGAIFAIAGRNLAPSMPLAT